jgi:effector-binding domain-containing protein
MIDTPHLTRTAAQPTAVIHLQVPREPAAMQRVMGPAINEVMAAIAAQGLAPKGPLFSHHFRMAPDLFDFEVGFPVDAAIAPTGRVQPSELPAVEVARTLYRGGYEGLAQAWGEFNEWITAAGLVPRENLWERYVTGPEADPDPSTWQTELNRPLRAS